MTTVHEKYDEWGEVIAGMVAQAQAANNSLVTEFFIISWHYWMVGYRTFLP